MVHCFILYFRTCTLDLEVLSLFKILLRVDGPAELLVVLSDVEDLEDLRSILGGEHDRNIDVPVHAIAVLLVDRRAKNRAVAHEKATPRVSLFRLPALGGSAVGHSDLSGLVGLAGLLLLGRLVGLLRMP
eukprot:7382737-Prymnesium_polylepis.1